MCFDTIDFLQTPQSIEDELSEEKIEVLAEMICQSEVFTRVGPYLTGFWRLGVSVLANSYTEFRNDDWDRPTPVSVCRDPMWEFGVSLVRSFRT